MKYTSLLHDNVLSVSLSGRIDSSNAKEAQKAIAAELARKKFDSIELDCDQLEFLSSAGLRVVLALWKQHKNVSLTHVPNSVYEVLDMTGFTKMMEVRRALREISVEGLPVVGEGFTATVYRLDQETIVKVFKGPRSFASVEAEIEAAKKAFIYGIPTAISYDVVKVGDRLGLVFEMLDCACLRDLIRDNPKSFETYKKMYADLSYTITHTKAPEADLQHCKGPLLEKFKLLLKPLGKKDYNKLIGMIKALPETETLTHGDFHVKNILVQNGEPVLIDMDAVALGHPIFELEGIYLSAKAYNVAEPDNAEKFFGLPQATIDALYDALLERYFPKATAAERKAIEEKIELLSTAHLAYQTIRYKRDENGRLKKALARVKELLAIYNTLDF